MWKVLLLIISVLNPLHAYSNFIPMNDPFMKFGQELDLENDQSTDNTDSTDDVIVTSSTTTASSATTASTEPPPVPQCDNGPYTCADCKTTLVCRPTAENTWIPVTEVACPPDMPFCDYSTGSCSKVEDTHCAKQDEFICLRDGKFPDPTDNTKFHICQNLTSITLECAVTGNSYNPDTEKCEANGPMGTFDCSGKSGVKVPYTSSTNCTSSYFAYCAQSSVVMVDRCCGNYQLNFTSQNCEAICQTDGLLPDETDCSKYYKCWTFHLNKNTSFRIREHQTCPDGEHFDSANYQCLPANSFQCQTCIR